MRFRSDDIAFGQLQLRKNRSDFGDEAWILSRRNLWQRPCQQIDCVIAPPLVGPFARLYCMQQNCRHRLLGFETDIDALLIMTVTLRDHLEVVLGFESSARCEAFQSCAGAGLKNFVRESQGALRLPHLIVENCRRCSGIVPGVLVFDFGTKQERRLEIMQPCREITFDRGKIRDQITRAKLEVGISGFLIDRLRLSYA
jgi:hypothetical protein